MRSGERCSKCNEGFFGVYRTVRTGVNDPVVRYLKCPKCGATGKSIVNPELSRRKLVTSAERH